MVDTTLLSKARMRSIVACVPVLRIMAAGAIRSKHAAMKSWVRMTSGTGGRGSGKSFGMTAAASQVGMCSGQFEG
jgi:hypothetical protein